MMTDKDAVLATMDAYADAYCAKDLDRLMGLFVDGEGISVIGTGADELCSGRAAVRALFQRNFEEATAAHFEWHWRDVVGSTDFAVIAATLTIHLKTQDGHVQVPVRWTVALTHTETGWCWLHRHASSAASSQKTGAAYPVDR